MDTFVLEAGNAFSMYHVAPVMLTLFALYGRFKVDHVDDKPVSVVDDSDPSSNSDAESVSSG